MKQPNDRRRCTKGQTGTGFHWRNGAGPGREQAAGGRSAVLALDLKPVYAGPGKAGHSSRPGMAGRNYRRNQDVEDGVMMPRLGDRDSHARRAVGDRLGCKGAGGPGRTRAKTGG